MAQTRKCLLLCSLMLLLSPELWSSEIDFGGLRKVQARVKSGGAGKLCEVSFLAVSCFDSKTNRAVNQRKARDYALMALAKDAGIVNGDFSAPDLRPISAPVINGNRLTQTFEASGVDRSHPVPALAQEGVKRHANTRVPASASLCSPGLLSCFHDMRVTLQAIAGSLEEELTLTGSAASLEEAIASIEGNAQDVFQRFEQEVKSQTLLLNIEKQSLLGETSQRQSAFLKHLRAAYESAQKH